MISEAGLYPAEHRALRELYATARSLAKHWDRLAARLEVETLAQGAAAARELIEELGPRSAQHDVHSRPAAQGAGLNLGSLRAVNDRLLERNQALRLALLDVQHVVTVLGWLEALATRRGDTEWAAFHRRWAQRLERSEAAVRDAVVALAQDPEAAVAPADDSALGRAGARLGQLIGTAGEAIDARAARLRRDG